MAPLGRKRGRLALLVLAPGLVAAASLPGRLPASATARSATSTVAAPSTTFLRIPGQSPAQSTALPPAGTPIPTRGFAVAATLWLPHAILSRPRVYPSPTSRFSPTPHASSTPAGTLEPPPEPTLPPSTPAATATQTRSPSTAVLPTAIPPSATPSPTVAPASATPLLCIALEREPNNAILEALDQPPLCPDQTGSAALPEGDVTDYFRLELPAPGLIVADLAALPAGTNYDLYLYTRQGQLLAISQLPDNQAEHAEVRVSTAGDYYARVYASSGRSAQAYAVSWTLRP